MKKYLIICLLVTMCFQANSQNAINDSMRSGNQNSYKKPAFAFIGFSTGFNNPSGFMGFDIDVAVKPYATIGAGMGISTWGNKMYIVGKYFLNSNYKGSAIAAGITYNTGYTNIPLEIQTASGDKEKINLNQYSQKAVFLGLYKYINIGKLNNKFVLSFGYSIPIDQCEYDITTPGVKLSDNGDNAIKFISPGGLMIGLGLLFGLQH